jgi:hypothetical protein
MEHPEVITSPLIEQSGKLMTLAHAQYHRQAQSIAPGHLVGK